MVIEHILLFKAKSIYSPKKAIQGHNLFQGQNLSSSKRAISVNPLMALLRDVIRKLCTIMNHYEIVNL